MEAQAASDHRRRASVNPAESCAPSQKNSRGFANSCDYPRRILRRPSQNPAPYIEDITRTLQGLLLGMPSDPSDPSDDGGVSKIAHGGRERLRRLGLITARS